MTYLEKLINKHCPDGYEWKHLWEITFWDKKFQGVEKFKQQKVYSFKYLLFDEIKSIIDNDGDIEILNTGKNVGLKTSTNKYKGPIYNCEMFCIPWGGEPNIKYFKGKFVTGDNRIAQVIDKNIFSTKFIYYYLMNNIDLIAKTYRGGSIKHPHMAKILDIPIPLIPLKIQEKIVEILERFRILEAELKAELEARRKQFCFWKKKLLAKTKKFNLIKVKEIAIYQNGAGHERFFDDQGDFILVNSKFISTNGEVIKKVSKNLLPLKINDIAIVLSDLPNGKALAKTFFVNENNKYALNQRICVLTIKDQKIINPKFLNYVLNRNIDLLSYDNGTDQTNLKKSDIENLKIYFPPLETQNKIVSILDKLSEYSQEINSGLPAEIELRSKQFKYYRDQLLNFKNNE